MNAEEFLANCTGYCGRLHMKLSPDACERMRSREDPPEQCENCPGLSVPGAAVPAKGRKKGESVSYDTKEAREAQDMQDEQADDGDPSAVLSPGADADTGALENPPAAAGKRRIPMGENNLAGLNDHLFAQLERLSNEDLKDKELLAKIERAEAVTGVAREIISIGNLALKAKMAVSSGGHGGKLPPLLEM